MAESAAFFQGSICSSRETVHLYQANMRQAPRATAGKASCVTGSPGG